MFAPQPAQAQTYTVPHEFTNGEDGAGPYDGLVMYAATGGGNYSYYCGGYCGIVFQMKRAGQSRDTPRLAVLTLALRRATPYWPEAQKVLDWCDTHASNTYGEAVAAIVGPAPARAPMSAPAPGRCGTHLLSCRFHNLLRGLQRYLHRRPASYLLAWN